MVKVYIDGQEGTTGLKILERFKNRSDIELLRIDEDKRKDADERRRLIHSADFTFLCLPDAAAREAVALAEGSNTRIIDASTAHRTNPDWAYGFPELGKDFREKIAKSSRTAVPGCYASGFISMVYPLVCDYFSGMVVSLPLHTRLLTKKYTTDDVRKALAEYYAGANFVKVMPEGAPEDGFLSANDLSGTNMMQLFVNGNDDRLILCSRLDNLGKGASGAAVQCLNIMMGIDETTGLL